jgi:peptide/nickel transport system substrate-binding protein
MTIAYPSEPPTLDPFAPGGDSTATRDILQLLMPSLLGPDGDNEVLAGPIQPDGDTATLSIREDARWSDGRAITVEDLKVTWQRGRAARQGAFHRIKNISSTNGVVTVSFDRPSTDLSGRPFSSGSGILPAHAMRTAAQRRSLARRFPVSGGPFVLKRWRRGLDMTFERNPNAFGPLIPQLDRLRIVFVPDALGALTLFKQGKVDALGPYSSADWMRRVGAVPGAQLTTERQTTWLSLVLANDQAPLKQAAVRRALVRSLDRRRTIAALIGADGEAASCHCGSYSLTGARSALEDAGWHGKPIRRRDGRSLSLTLAIDDTDELAGALARALQRQAALAGFDIQLIALSTDVLWREWLHSDDLDAALLTTRGQDLTGRTQFALASLNATLAAEAGLTLATDAGPDGPFSLAAKWHR